MYHSPIDGAEVEMPEILVVGCGVIGLTCAVLLQENGFNVRIIADKKPSDTVSNKAAAVWFPFGVDYQNDARIIDWCRSTCHKLDLLSREADSGISFVNFIQAFETKNEFQQKEKEGLLSWTNIPRRFQHPVDNLPASYEYGYEIEVPLMNTRRYLAFLKSKLEHKIEIIDSIDSLSELYERYPRIVNCTGIGAGELVEDDKVYPTRGQVVVIKKPKGMDRSFVHIKERSGKDPELTYIILRDEDCVLGGTAEKNNWDEIPNTETTLSIIERCKKLQPALHGLNEENVLDVKVGLRSGRKKVRLEYEPVTSRSGVIHNYGHGGAGFTMAWGCAEAVLRLALKHF